MLKAKIILFDTRIPEKDFLYYSIPEDLRKDVYVGRGVIVPLKKRRVLGYVWDILEDDSIDTSIETKPVYSIVDKFSPLPKSLIDLVNWISFHYENSLFKTANYIFPPGVELKIKRIFKRKEEFSLKLTQKQQKIFDSLIEEKTLEELRREIGKISESLIRNLVKKGALEEKIEVELFEKHPRKEYYYDPIVENWNINKNFTLEFFKIKEKFDKPLLLFVENRKERWEFYIEIAKYFYNLRKQVLILFPTLNSLRDFADFAINKVPERIYFFHGLLTPAQSYQIFKLSGIEERIFVISTGKGIFLPFNNLGVIILDEEENEFYNYREKEPRFDIYDVSKKRAELEGIPIVLGSSSPSVNSFFEYIKGKLFLYRKPHPKAKITVIDMRKERKDILSYYSLRRVREILKEGKQVFFLLNRLGYSTYLQCQDCGYTFYCPHCSTSLVYHAEDLELRCHYCGYKIPSVTTCPKCGGYSFNYGGLGTERLESYLRRLFPKYIVQRWDSDTEIKDETLLYNSNIIVGTRLIVPWIPKLSVGLLVIVNFDNFLHIPDFSISEKTFNLVRRILGDFMGEEIIIQTYSPNHYVLRALRVDSYSLFLHEELKLRKELKYPPFSYLHQILITGEDEDEIKEISLEIKKRVEKLEEVEVLGPAPYFPYILKEKYRYQILIKVPEEDKIVNLEEIAKYEDIFFSNFKITKNKYVKEIIT